MSAFNPFDFVPWQPCAVAEVVLSVVWLWLHLQDLRLRHQRLGVKS